MTTHNTCKHYSFGTCTLFNMNFDPNDTACDNYELEE